ncbi:MAG TPA: hypothetical protein DCR76_02005 [Ruminococcaceae bacterium]|nr:hypothetical protein [Oscillospiraceae bacterium]
MYRIKMTNADNKEFLLYDPNIQDLAVTSATVNLESNTAGSATLVFPCIHPHYSILNDKTAIFSIYEDNEIIFKGRIYEVKKDWNNSLTVTLEGFLAVLSDVLTFPFEYPGGYVNDKEYQEGENDVRFFCKKMIVEHYNNVCSGDFGDLQVEYNPIQLTLGNITVKDDGSGIVRSSEDYITLWDIVKDKLFGSALGGYVSLRYVGDKNYFDYVKNFTETNSQVIEFGKNLTDITDDEVSTDTVSAVLALGKDNLRIPTYNSETPKGYKEGQTVSTDGDLFYHGYYIVSKKALQKYGWRSKIVKYDSVEKETETLLKKAVAFMQSEGIRLKKTIEVSAIDLHLTDSQIISFRINKKVNVISKPHNINVTYDLTKLSIDMLNPQNTKITVTNTDLVY